IGIVDLDCVGKRIQPSCLTVFEVRLVYQKSLRTVSKMLQQLYYLLVSTKKQLIVVFFFSSRRLHTRFSRDWSSDVCSSDPGGGAHSFMRWQERAISDSPRFQYLAEMYGYLARQFTVFGQHIHLGVPSGDAAVRMVRGLSP